MASAGGDGAQVMPTAPDSTNPCTGEEALRADQPRSPTAPGPQPVERLGLAGIVAVPCGAAQVCLLLGVLPHDVANAGDRRLPSERAVGPAFVVVAEPVWQGGCAVGAGAVGLPERSFALERLRVALDLPVCLRAARGGRRVCRSRREGCSGAGGKPPRRARLPWVAVSPPPIGSGAPQLERLAEGIRAEPRFENGA